MNINKPPWYASTNAWPEPWKTKAREMADLCYETGMKDGVEAVAKEIMALDPTLRIAVTKYLKGVMQS